MSPINGDDKAIGPAIGIDLGTWKCCVGVFRNGKVEIIENERSCKTTPSYVAFTETERIIGEDAKSQVALNPKNTVYGVKRIIGRRFNDPSLQDIKDTFPFTVVDHDGKPFIEVMYKRKNTRLCPEQVTAMLLTKMKRVAESHLGCEVKNAVISVPAYFNNAQRQATMDAGVIAGLNVLGLINEPTAAALAYRDNKGPTDETICVVDLGGGTIDVSVIKMEGEKGITVMETHGNTSMGGIDLDQRLLKHFKEEFSTKSNQNITGNSKALERLRVACEKLKHTLSLLPTTQIQLDCLASDTDLESSIARSNFEKLCRKDFTESLFSVLTKVLRGSSHECERQYLETLDKVVLVGGSTRIPHVQELLKEALHTSLDKSVNPDEAVAHGAAIMAAMLELEASVNDVVVRDVTSHTFVMQDEESREVVFLQNSHEQQRAYTIESENLFDALHDLSECVFDIRTNAELSHRHVGSIRLSDLLAIHVHSQLCFTINDSGIFCGYLVVEEGCHRFSFDSDHLNTEQLPAMEKQEKMFRVDEEDEKSRLISLSDLEACCFNKKTLIEELTANGSEVEKLKQEFIDFCEGTIDWLDGNPEATKDVCESRKKVLEGLLNVLVPPSLETKEIDMNTKQPPTTVDQRAWRNSFENKSKNDGGQGSVGTSCGNGIQDPFQRYPNTRSISRQQASQDREDFDYELHQKSKKTKLNDLTKFAAQTNSMEKCNTMYQNYIISQQEPVGGPWRYNNDACLGRGMSFSGNHFSVQKGSSEDLRARQATWLLPAVHKPGQPTASGANNAKTGHNGGHSLGPPYSSQTSIRRQQTETEHGNFIPEKGQGLNTYLRSLARKQKPSRDLSTTAHSSYDIGPDYSSDEELSKGHVRRSPPKKQSHSNTSWIVFNLSGIPPATVGTRTQRSTHNSEKHDPKKDVNDSIPSAKTFFS